MHIDKLIIHSGCVNEFLHKLFFFFTFTLMHCSVSNWKQFLHIKHVTIIIKCVLFSFHLILKYVVLLH